MLRSYNKKNLELKTKKFFVKVPVPTKLYLFKGIFIRISLLSLSCKFNTTNIPHICANLQL